MVRQARSSAPSVEWEREWVEGAGPHAQHVLPPASRLSSRKRRNSRQSDAALTPREQRNIASVRKSRGYLRSNKRKGIDSESRKYPSLQYNSTEDDMLHIAKSHRDIDDAPSEGVSFASTGSLDTEEEELDLGLEDVQVPFPQSTYSEAFAGLYADLSLLDPDQGEEFMAALDTLRLATARMYQGVP